MKQYELIIFDLDGTILNTTQGILSSVKYVIQELGLSAIGYDKMLSFIGPPIQDSFSKYYNLSGNTLQKATDMFRFNYSNQNLFLAEPYSGIYDVMSYLKANKIVSAVATYKREDYAVRLLNHFAINKYTNIMFGADNDNILKKKDIILKCIDKSGVSDLKKIIVVGDTLHDALGAQALDLDFIAVRYGFGFKPGEDQYTSNTIVCIDKPLEIIDFIEN